LCPSGKVVLQRVGLNSGFCQCVRSPRRGRQTFDTVTFTVSGVTDGAQRGRLAGSGDSLQRRDLIAATEDLLYGSMLGAAETGETPSESVRPAQSPG
jgi:hypothetical protein